MSVIKADLDELVFRARNKAYGSYELRKKYGKSTLLGFLIGCSVFTVALSAPRILELLKSEEEAPVVEKKKFSYADLADPPPVNREDQPPPPPDVQAPPPPARAQVQFVPPTVVRNEEAPPEATIVNIDTFKTNVDAGARTVEGDPNAVFSIGDEEGEGTGPVEIVEDKDPEPTAFVPVEKEPAPVNLDAIKKLIGYPPIAKEAGIQGQVIVRILVDAQGNYLRHVVLRSPHPSLEKEVVEKIKMLKFTPGIQGGKPIKVWVTIPFNFQLQN